MPHFIPSGLHSALVRSILNPDLKQKKSPACDVLPQAGPWSTICDRRNPRRVVAVRVPIA